MGKNKDGGIVLTYEQTEKLCKDMGERLRLDLRGYHVAALFKDNTKDDIIGFAVLDKNNKIISQHIGEVELQEMFNLYDLSKN